MSVKSLIIEKLVLDGYHGLTSASRQCACFLGDEDCPCDEMNVECLPGHIETKEITIKTIKVEYEPALEVVQPWVLVED